MEPLTNECTACPRGRFRPDVGGVSFTSCTECPADSTTALDNPAAQARTDCLCDVNAVVIPVTMDPDFKCICQAGRYMLNGVCEQCPKDTYLPTTGAISRDECLSCGEIAVTDLPGATTKELCYCPENSVLVGTACTQCGMGEFYNGDIEILACQRCPGGRYQVQNEHINEECDICPFGFFCQEGATALTACSGAQLCPAETEDPFICCDPNATPQDTNSVCKCNPGYFALPPSYYGEPIWGIIPDWGLEECANVPISGDQPVCQECPNPVVCDDFGNTMDTLILPVGYWQDPSYFNVNWEGNSIVQVQPGAGGGAGGGGARRLSSLDEMGKSGGTRRLLSVDENGTTTEGVESTTTESVTTESVTTSESVGPTTTESVGSTTSESVGPTTTESVGSTNESAGSTTTTESVGPTTTESVGPTTTENVGSTNESVGSTTTESVGSTTTESVGSTTTESSNATSSNATSSNATTTESSNATIAVKRPPLPRITSKQFNSLLTLRVAMSSTSPIVLVDTRGKIGLRVA